MTNGNDSAMPVVFPGFTYADGSHESTSVKEGITKREYFAAVAQVPQLLFENEINEWKGDNGEAPRLSDLNFNTMLKNLATIDAEYRALLAEALLKELNENT